MVRFHYQYSDPDFGKNMADKLEQELRALLEDVSVKVVHDVGVVEVRSFLGDRGDILKTLLARYKEEKGVNPEVVLCLGDSSVDEPMFSCGRRAGVRHRTLLNYYRGNGEEEEPEVITCTTGAKASNAQYYTSSVEENFRRFSMLTEDVQ